MEFSPFNNVVKFCIQGMEMEERGKAEEAKELFHQSWDEGTNDFEKFLAANCLARHQETVSNKLTCLKASLH